MELFDNETGHITEEGFSFLLERENGAGAPTEGELLAALELSEHLAFCDRCCAEYTRLLAGGPLAEPPHDLAGPVMGRIRRRKRVILLRQSFKAGLAACLALALWGAGVFSTLPGMIPTAPPRSLEEDLTRETRRNEEANASLQQYLDGQNAPPLQMQITDAIEGFFQALTEKGDAEK